MSAVLGRPLLRLIAAGLLGGVLLSAMRAPTGLDVTHVPAVDGTTAAFFRAAGLLLFAAVMGRVAKVTEGSGVSVGWLLAAVTAGFGLHGLLLKTLWEPESRLGFGATVVILTAGAYFAVSRPGRGGEGEGEAPNPIERLGLGAAAAGATLALLCLAYHLRHLGMMQPEDDTVLGLVFLALLTVGAVAFGAPLAKGDRAPAVLAGGLALAAVAALAGVEILHGLLDPGALDAYVRRFGLDLGLVGTLRYLALIGGAVLVVPGFVAGTALAGARHRRRLSCVLLGAAAGTALWPWFVEMRAMSPLSYGQIARGEAGPWTWERVTHATWIAAAGAAVAAFFGTSGRTRLAAIGAALLAALLVFAPPRRGLWVFAPWQRLPAEPELVLHSRHGMLTVEPARGGARVVTVDRRRVTPLGIEEDQDADRIRFAWALLGHDLRASDAARVLFVGQMTPARAFTFDTLGEIRLDRTVPWHSHAKPIDDFLFQGQGEPPGTLLAPAEARRRLEDGSYDLVIVPPAHGPVVLPKSAANMPWAAAPAPATATLDVPDGTTAVVWLDAASPIANRDLGDRAILCSRGMDDLNVGMVLGDATEREKDAPAIVDPGPPAWRQGALSFVRTRALMRADRQKRDVIARIAAANEGGALADLCAGLALHAAAQRPSSPFETPAQRMELDDEALEAFARAADAAAPDAFARGWWEGLAEVLTGKRMPDKVLTFVQPVAESHGPWPTLERAVATAYREFGMPSEAADWYGRALESAPYDIALLLDAAEWSGRAGDDAREIELLRRADGIQPDRLDVAKRLGAALLRAGDEAGRAILEAALKRHPEDEELIELIEHGPGAREAIGPPVPGAHDHDHD